MIVNDPLVSVVSIILIIPNEVQREFSCSTSFDTKNKIIAYSHKKLMAQTAFFKAILKYFSMSQAVVHLRHKFRLPNSNSETARNVDVIARKSLQP